jgi:GNAT superfamily N-acetyltransferase
VHGYKKGIGNYQKKGIGKALLQAAETDAKSLGLKGIAAWGITWPFWSLTMSFHQNG